MPEFKKRLIIACSCLVLGSVGILFQVFGGVSSH
jgi:hypothetical protein